MVFAAYGTLQHTSCSCFPRRALMQRPVATAQQLDAPVAACRQGFGGQRRLSHSSSRKPLGRLHAAPAAVGERSPKMKWCSSAALQTPSPFFRHLESRLRNLLLQGRSSRRQRSQHSSPGRT